MCDSCFAWLMGAGWDEDEAAEAEAGASSTALAVHPFKRKKHEGDSKVQLNKNARLAMDGWIEIIKMNIERQSVFAYAIDGYLMYYSREIPKYELGEEKYRLGVVELTGASCTKKTFESSFEIHVRTHDDILLEFDSSSRVKQAEWHHAINKQIEDANVIYASSGGLQEANPNAGAKEWYTQLLKKKRGALTSIRQETIMTKHYTNFGGPKSHQRVLYLDEKNNALCWRDPSVPRVSADCKSIPIDDIAELAEGNKTDALSVAITASNKTRIACCWALIGYSEYVAEFEAQSIGEKERWVTALRELIKIRKIEVMCELSSKKKSSRLN